VWFAINTALSPGTPIIRSYQRRAKAAGGDWAVSYEHIEPVSIPAEHWTIAAGEPRRPGYCDDLE
jgi:hypothetical protein